MLDHTRAHVISSRFVVLKFAVFGFKLSRLQIFWISYIGLGCIAWIAELIRPAHKVKYFARDAFWIDVVALVFMQAAVVPLAGYVTDPMQSHLFLPSAWYELWLPVRIAICYLVADCGSYWMHRLMHRYLWRIHRWHHAPTQLYWFAGVRATLPQQILFNVPYFAMIGLGAAPPEVGLWMMIAAVLTNHWMHMNVAWRSNWLEKFFVTPRYHHIHHSTNVELHDGNYGTLFTIWDRLFGTYIDPDVTVPKKFGTGEKRDTVLLMIGV
jgi:sterol desaturase/sphingolipid hydroxylase (fatty acid hydroxylase superfamily)